MDSSDAPIMTGDSSFTPSMRILVFGGILLLIINMLFGEMFAIFISHVANGEIRLRWIDLVNALAAGDVAALRADFDRIEVLLERRSRIINTHSHLGGLGVVALCLAMLQNLLPYAEKTKCWLAAAYVAGGFIQPLFVFVSIYTASWANWVSDIGGMLILLALVGTIAGLFQSKVTSDGLKARTAALLSNASARLLLRSGLSLILLGMLFGLYYAWVFNNAHEPAQFALVDAALSSAANNSDAEQIVRDYRSVQSRIGLSMAVHSHWIETGLLAILLAFAQSFVYLSERWRKRWALTFIGGAFLMPICIHSAMLYGLFFAAFADLSGLAILIGLVGMLVGLVRHTGVADQTLAGAAS
jgi:hypothetical protein